MEKKSKVFVYAVAILFIIVVTSWTTAIINSKLQVQGVVNNIYSECNCTVPIVQESDNDSFITDSESESENTTTGEETTVDTSDSKNNQDTSFSIKTTTTTESHTDHEPDQNDIPEDSQPLEDRKSVV